jgi:hypothetical protein
MSKKGREYLAFKTSSLLSTFVILISGSMGVFISEPISPFPDVPLSKLKVGMRIPIFNLAATGILFLFDDLKPSGEADFSDAFEIPFPLRLSLTKT